MKFRVVKAGAVFSSYLQWNVLDGLAVSTLSYGRHSVVELGLSFRYGGHLYSYQLVYIFSKV